MDIAEIRKNKTETIKVTVDEYEGHTFASVRVFTKEGDKLYPTKKGIALGPRVIEDVIDALRIAAAKLAKKEGKA